MTKFAVTIAMINSGLQIIESPPFGMPIWFALISGIAMIAYAVMFAVKAKVSWP